MQNPGRLQNGEPRTLVYPGKTVEQVAEDLRARAETALRYAALYWPLVSQAERISR